MSVQVRERDPNRRDGLRLSELPYDQVPDPERAADPSRNSWDDDYEAGGCCVTCCALRLEDTTASAE